MTDELNSEKRVVVIGAGPAGLTAAYGLTEHNVPTVVVEKGKIVGGIARTESYKGYYFDMGGHRFLTKSSEVTKIWRKILGKDFLHRPRLSRIYYKRKFFYYPLKPLNALKGLGLFESFLILLSCLRWKMSPHRREDTFEQWVTNRFGSRLFHTFFKTYTEKVWGIPCSQLKAEWAAQRIKGLSLKTVVLNMLLQPKKAIKTLTEEFDYPRLGPGMMWNRVKEEIERRGGAVLMETDVTAVAMAGNRVDSITVSRNGQRETITGTHFISSMPVTEFIKKIDPPPPAAFLLAAGKLHYRDFLTVCLIVNKPNLFPDNWIYIHDPSVKVGRIQNFKNWSPEMVPDPARTSLGLEYFCNEGDDLWNTADKDLIEIGKREMDCIGLARYADIEDGCVFRVPKAYPVYDSDYGDYLVEVRKFIDGLENFQTIGRNGLHRYNNQDHAMLTGLFAVRNVVLGERNDLWSVNTEQEYHEEIRQKVEMEPEIPLDAVKEAFARAFAKLDRVAFGVAIGAVTGLLLFASTLLLVLKGGDVVGPNFQLLAQYFPGYSVTFSGSLVGLECSFLTGFLSGWAYALLRNLAVFLYTALIERRAERLQLHRFLEYV
jgi:protoporphyrinogen oxidase